MRSMAEDGPDGGSQMTEVSNRISAGGSSARTRRRGRGRPRRTAARASARCCLSSGRPSSPPSPIWIPAISPRTSRAVRASAIACSGWCSSPTSSPCSSRRSRRSSASSRAAISRSFAASTSQNPLVIFYWIVSEIAAMATDLAEFLGATIGFNLLFGLPLCDRRHRHRRHHLFDPAARAPRISGRSSWSSARSSA